MQIHQLILLFARAMIYFWYETTLFQNLSLYLSTIRNRREGSQFLRHMKRPTEPTAVNIINTFCLNQKIVLIPERLLQIISLFCVRPLQDRLEKLEKLPLLPIPEVPRKWDEISLGLE